jgi:hypothetical protein
MCQAAFLSERLDSGILMEGVQTAVLGCESEANAPNEAPKTERLQFPATSHLDYSLGSSQSALLASAFID